MYGRIGKYVSSQFAIYEKELRFYTEDEIFGELVRSLITVDEIQSKSVKFN